MSLSTKVLDRVRSWVLLAGFFFGEEVGISESIRGCVYSAAADDCAPLYHGLSDYRAWAGSPFSEAASLGRKCGVLLLVLWGIGLAMVLVMPLAFPAWESASFFSTSLIEPKRPFNFLGLYIPANLFNSLANNTVPAVVVFSFAFGVALIGLKGKEVLLRGLSAIAEVLGRITAFFIDSLRPLAS